MTACKKSLAGHYEANDSDYSYLNDSVDLNKDGTIKYVHRSTNKKESGIYETFEGTWKQDGDTPYIKIDIKNGNYDEYSAGKHLTAKVSDNKFTADHQSGWDNNLSLPKK
ncbi:hypothetical protein FD06_GL000464 [Apilactobacillus ozensis DSM 23829 = JCM 17196]|uniref:DUF3642 domain-containing protein n=2 Tax=Apilactobacillus ozensis TaxID=866801 RepID=A0A0R2AKM6_9LACO|nr:hypothetical protein FD06_GL000464 [Apilactobacillus ozensis DSM 23829 = JCM 17196]